METPIPPEHQKSLPEEHGRSAAPFLGESSPRTQQVARKRMAQTKHLLLLVFLTYCSDTLTHWADSAPLSFLLSDSTPAIYHLSLLSFVAVSSTEKKYTTLLFACFPIQ